VGTGELVGSNLDVNSEVASALLRGSSIEAMSARTQGLPADFFEVHRLLPLGETSGETVSPATAGATDRGRSCPGTGFWANAMRECGRQSIDRLSLMARGVLARRPTNSSFFLVKAGSTSWAVLS
jgi:hypothetical protein